MVCCYPDAVTCSLEEIYGLPHPENEHFGRLLEEARTLFWFARPGAIIYADVGGTQSHKAAMQDREWRNEHKRGGEESEQFLADRTRVLELYKASMPGSEVDEDEETAFLKAHFDETYITPDMLDHLISLKTKEDKKRAMTLLSGEVTWKIPRPVMVLINMYEDCQATSLGNGSGYAMAYNVVEDMIIIKSYSSSLEHHPLDEPWNVTPKVGSLYFKGSPGAFAHRIATRADLDEASPHYGFDLVNRVLVGEWIPSPCIRSTKARSRLIA